MKKFNCTTGDFGYTCISYAPKPSIGVFCVGYMSRFWSKSLFAYLSEERRLFWDCDVEEIRQSLCCSTMPNVSISRCAYASFSQNANLLRSFINITQGRYLLPGTINTKVQALFVTVIYEDQVLYAKPKNEILFVRIKLLYTELSPFQIELFMVQLS